MGLGSSKSTNVQNTSTETITTDARAQADAGSVVSTGGDVNIINADSSAIIDNAQESMSRIESQRIDLLGNVLNRVIDTTSEISEQATVSQRIAAQSNASQAAALGQITDKAVSAGTGQSSETSKYLVGFGLLLSLFGLYKMARRTQ